MAKKPPTREQRAAKRAKRMEKCLDLLKNRHTPIFKDGLLALPDSSLATLGDDGVVRLFPQTKLESSDDSLMLHAFRISTPTPDRVGDVMVPRGCEKYLGNYKSNPVVFFNHKKMGLPIGLAKHPQTQDFLFQVSDDDVLAGCWFHGKTAESVQVYELVKLGVLSATSIGFNPKLITRNPTKSKTTDDPKGTFRVEPDGLKFMEWELLEWSVVGLPCNSETVALGPIKSILSKNLCAGSQLSEPLKDYLNKLLPADSTTVVTFTDLPVPAPEPAPEVKAEETPQTPEVQPTPPEKTLDETEPGERVPETSEVAVATSDVGKVSVPEVVKDHADPMAPLALDPVPAIEPTPEPEKKPRLPIGAQVLKKVLSCLDGAYHLVEDRLPEVDNPKTTKFLSEVHQDLDGLMRKIHKFAGKAYPDHFPKTKDSEVEVEKIEPGVANKVEVKPDLDPATVTALAKLAETLGRLANDNDALKKKIYRLTGK